MPFELTNALATIYQATTRIRGDQPSADRGPVKRGVTLTETKSSYTMTLPEVPESGTRIHLPTRSPAAPTERG